MSCYFVGGVGTDVGKSIATAAMARYLLSRGVNAITMKMVQTGNDGFSEDIELHRKYMKRRYPEDETGLTFPVVFRFPASAHLAAAMENSVVDVEKIRRAADTLNRKYEVVLIEGAGGLTVPLREDLMTIDFVREMNWPVILVAGSYLGSLNHAILSLEAMAGRRMPFAGVVYNQHGACHELITRDTERMIRRALTRYGFAERLAVLPPGQSPETPVVDFSAIFGGNER